MKRWDGMGQRQRTEDHGKVIFGFFFFFFFSPSYIPPVSRHFQRSRRLSVLRYDLELFDDQRRKSARIILFLSSPWSGFRQLSTTCKSDDLLATNKECFSSDENAKVTFH